MGAKITVEEISGYSDKKIEEMSTKTVSELKPEVKVIYDERIKKIQDKKNAPADTGANPAADPAANGTMNEEEKVAGSGGANVGEGQDGTGGFKDKGWAAGNQGPKTLKLVLTGDTAVGKSCLITNYLDNSFTDDYEPTVLDVYRGIKSVKKKQIEIEIHDTSGDEHLGVNRKVQYQNADCFMICVACNQPSSLENVERWLAEIREVELEKPIALILTKSDLAGDLDDAITIENLNEKKDNIGVNMTAPTSSKEWEDFNVHKAFNKMLTAAYTFKYEL